MAEDQTLESDEGWYSNTAATFGDRVAGAREALGLSQADLAKKLGVKLQTVHGWEDDISEPRANKLQMMSGVLNVSLTWLLTGEGDGLTGPDDAEPIPADISAILIEMRQLRAEFSQLTDRLGHLEKRLRLSARG